MKLKKFVLTVMGTALVGVGTLFLSSNSTYAAENSDSTTVTFNVKQSGQSGFAQKTFLDSKVYAKTLWDLNGGPGGYPSSPRIWGSDWRWW